MDRGPLSRNRPTYPRELEVNDESDNGERGTKWQLNNKLKDNTFTLTYCHKHWPILIPKHSNQVFHNPYSVV